MQRFLTWKAQKGGLEIVIRQAQSMERQYTFYGW